MRMVLHLLLYTELTPSFYAANDCEDCCRNVSQTCAFSRTVLMTGTIAGMLRLSAENHLGLPGGPILIVLSRNVATCTMKPAVQLTLPPRRREESSTKVQLVPQGDSRSLCTWTVPPTFVLVSLIRCTIAMRQLVTIEHYCKQHCKAKRRIGM